MIKARIYRKNQKICGFEISGHAGYAAAGEDTSLLVNNVANVRTFEVKTPDVVVKVNPERADLVNTMTVDGKRCLVIEINDSVEVNGINVKTFKN